ncbi:MAG: ferric iron reductase, partial [Mesorhizobium sp.]
GYRFAPLFEERGHSLNPFDGKETSPATFEGDISLTRSLLIDSCFVCHLHEIALCLCEQYAQLGTSPWRILREETEAALDALRPRMLSDAFWLRERNAFLEDPWPTRSVLRMHLQRYRLGRVEHQLPNPLAEVQ